MSVMRILRRTSGRPGKKTILADVDPARLRRGVTGSARDPGTTPAPARLTVTNSRTVSSGVQLLSLVPAS
jgi:hypothetical protein